MGSYFPWKAVAVGAAVVGGLGVITFASQKKTAPPVGRVALIGDSYAVGLGPELQKLFPDFKYEGHVGNNTWQWATHAPGCVSCGDWLTAFKPDVVLVALGVNDTKPDLKNYQTIISALHGIGARVVWVEPPVQRVTNTLYDAIRALGVQRVPATNVPLSVDGLHPTGAGYKTWAQEIAQVVRGT